MRRIAVSLVLLIALVFLPLLSQPPRAAALSPAAAVGDFMMYLPFVFKAVAEQMVPVYAGSFWRGCDPAVNDLLELPCDPSGDEQPIGEVYLSFYEIYKYEVTNLQYRACVAAGYCTPPQSVGSFTRPDYFTNPAYNNYPVVNVTWDQADTYCGWVGKRLPTEAQWEKAARGSADARVFPWGNDLPTCSLANFFDTDQNQYCSSDLDPDTMEVSSFTAGTSPYGALNMSGNVWEWVNDWYSATYYQEDSYFNPIGPESGDGRVFRGGGYTDFKDLIRVSYRNYGTAGYYRDDHGFRCVRNY